MKNNKTKSSSATKSPKSHNGLILLKWLLILGIWGCLVISCGLVWFGYDLPASERLMATTRRASLVLLARDGVQFATYGDVYGQFVEAQDLPAFVSDAIIAIEDHRFYHHFGIDLTGILRAAWTNYRAGSIVQGGSTLTQQLAKNFLLSEKIYTHNDRSLRRKIQELILALWLETKFSKQQILSLYINRVYLGAGVYGIQAAAQKYFGKKAQQLTVYEAAVIAGLLKAPSKYSPTNSAEWAHERARTVLNQMIDAGMISREHINDIDQAPQKLARAHMKAMIGRYFADWIYEKVHEIMGHTDQDVIVMTTLDLTIQSQAEYHLQNLMMTEGFAANAHQAALVAMTPSGAIRAMVGGADYAHSQFNRAVQAKRQISSTVKIFIYLAALEYGFTPQSLISDLPLRISGWSPKNYKWQSRGDVSLRTAMAHSLNTPVVRLTQTMGLKRVQKLMRRLGLLSPQPDNLTITLGSGEATLLEMTAAYASLSNNGFGVWPYGIQSIKTPQGQVLYERKAQGAGHIVAPQHVRNIVSMMQTVMTEGTGRKSVLDRPCAGKSGTSQDYRDAWFIGFTPDLVTGVWMGNDDNSSMEHVSGGKLPGRLWYNFMTEVHKGLPRKNFSH